MVRSTILIGLWSMVSLHMVKGTEQRAGHSKRSMQQLVNVYDWWNNLTNYEKRKAFIVKDGNVTITLSRTVESLDHLPRIIEQHYSQMPRWKNLLIKGGNIFVIDSVQSAAFQTIDAQSIQLFDNEIQLVKKGAFKDCRAKNVEIEAATIEYGAFDDFPGSITLHDLKIACKIAIALVYSDPKRSREKVHVKKR